MGSFAGAAAVACRRDPLEYGGGPPCSACVMLAASRANAGSGRPTGMVTLVSPMVYDSYVSVASFGLLFGKTKPNVQTPNGRRIRSIIILCNLDIERYIIDLRP